MLQWFEGSVGVQDGGEEVMQSHAYESVRGKGRYEISCMRFRAFLSVMKFFMRFHAFGCRTLRLGLRKSVDEMCRDGAIVVGCERIFLLLLP